MKRILLSLLTIGTISLSCTKSTLEPYTGEYDKVFIYCGLGFNNLNSYLRSDFNELISQDTPGKYRDMAVLAYCHNTKSGYNQPVSPVLMRLYFEAGKTKIDTLVVYPEHTNSATKESLATVLNDIKQRFPSRHYGMLLSSHATGWIPDAYPQYGENSNEEIIGLSIKPNSVGAYIDGNKQQSSIDIHDFADAIPFHLQYLIFDACFMGTIESSWALKDISDYIIASPTEVIAKGMDYRQLVHRLLYDEQPDLEGVCRDYFEYYNNQSGLEQSATIALYDSSKIEPVADAFAAIVAAHRDQLEAVDHASVQRYHRRSSGSQYFYPFFFDLRDYALAMGANSDELAQLDYALDQFILYHAQTPQFFSEKLLRCCGVSCYIPYPNYDILNSYYRLLDWNKRVSLIQ